MISGSCLCKAVSYQADATIEELVVCHCSFCRKATASAYSVNARVFKDQFKLLCGAEQLVSYSSSPGKDRYYCKTCHSQIYHTQDSQPELLTLKMGLVDTTDQDLSAIPKRHIYKDPAYIWLES
ncbi:GFA family protein [Streptococcus caviae]|uniref:GFA family protein n=1 Tax=Streptococcus sp. 'caviae' TaxID=1915004 RepID=UPI00094BC2C7|nr:GFA family protein [Streptococcus sp. 'caviae']OLN84548.1 aldehyde-activating protein [Streptococcus sp. 'caviae']